MSQKHKAVIETLAQIEAPDFRAGIVLWNDRVVDFAPIVKYMKGWTRAGVRYYCQQRGWKPRVIWEMTRTDVGVRYLIGETANWPAVAKPIIDAERVRQAPGGHHVRAEALELLPRSD